MPDQKKHYAIYHDLIIKAPVNKVFGGVSTPKLLDEWWTQTCKNAAGKDNVFELGFTPNCIWYGKVIKHVPNSEFELLIFDSHNDWNDTAVGFILNDKGGTTRLSFYHSNWKEVNEHFRISSYCWAVYLRVLKGYLEKGIRIPYHERDNV
ncbi:SRPBCC domain-containing protein [bacterium]|nr:SRPBCC domain-containing protein [bacterium]